MSDRGRKRPDCGGCGACEDCATRALRAFAPGAKLVIGLVDLGLSWLLETALQVKPPEDRKRAMELTPEEQNRELRFLKRTLEKDLDPDLARRARQAGRSEVCQEVARPRAN